MGRLIADEFLSLDGVVQAPSYPDEDTSGGFRHGGWHSRFLDEESAAWIVDGITRAAGYLLGRGTYEMFAAHWPTASDAEQAFARPLNERPKYVAATTLTEPLGWHNATLIGPDVPTAVAELKANRDGDLHAIGSPGLVRSLIAAGLVDELRLMIDPVLLGGGKRAFPADGALRSLRLVESRSTGTGAILATYAKD